MRPSPRLFALLSTALVAVPVLLGGPTAAASADGQLGARLAPETIPRLTSQITVTPNGLLNVAETVRYDFGPNLRHGIYREIPLKSPAGGGAPALVVTVGTVTADGKPAPVTEETSAGILRIRIGDPNITMRGAHTYVIHYTVRGALVRLSGEDAAAIGGGKGDIGLNWDFIGNGWSVPVARAAATVSGPSPIAAVHCFQGPRGSTRACPVASRGSSAAFGPVSLAIGSGMTGVTVFRAEGFGPSA